MGTRLRDILGSARTARGTEGGSGGGSGGRRRVAVWERAAAGWRVLLGEVGGRAPRVLRAATLPAPSDATTGSPKAVECILVVSSRRCVVRTVELPAVPDADRERMLALRLEAELPYALGEAAWGHRGRLPIAGEPASALVVAVPADELARAEQELERSGRRCEVVEAREAALAQLADCLAPDVETAAVVAVEPDGATLAVTHEGRMAYARALASGLDREGGEVARTALELEQTLQHFAYESGLGAPEAVFVVGEARRAERLREALRARTDLPVRDLPGAAGVEVAPEAGAPGDVLAGYASCVGALAAAHERCWGREGSGPVVRARRTPRRGSTARSVVRLGLMNVLLVAALIGSGFTIRRSRLDGAKQAVAEARPLLAETGPLAEEVSILQAEGQRARAKLYLLLALVEALPDGIELAELRIDRRGNVTMRGKTPSVEAVSKAVAALEDSDAFKGPHFDRVEPAKQGMTFQINCTVQ